MPFGGSAENVFLSSSDSSADLVAEMHASLQEFFNSYRTKLFVSFSVNWFNVLTIAPGTLPKKSNQLELGNGF